MRKKQKKKIGIVDKGQGKILIEIAADINLDDMLQYVLALFVVLIEKFIKISPQSLKNEESVVVFFEMLTDVLMNYLDKHDSQLLYKKDIYQNTGLSDKEIQMAEGFKEYHAKRYKDLIVH